MAPLDSHFMLFVLSLAVLVRDVQGDNIEQSDPFLRRVLLLVVTPMTGAILYFTAKAYFPDYTLKEVVTEMKQTATAKRQRPKWWEGGTLGGASNIKNIELTQPRPSQHHPLRKPARSSVTVFDPPPPPADLPWDALNDPISDEENTPTPIPQKPLSEILNGIINNEEMQRAKVGSHCSQEWFSLARERDMDRKRVLLTERRRVAHGETEGRRDIEADEATHFSNTTLRLWDEVSDRQLYYDREGDVRYALLSEEASARRGLAGTEFEGRIIAATVDIRRNLQDNESTERADIVTTQHHHHADHLLSFATSFFSATEATVRSAGITTEQHQRYTLLLTFNMEEEMLERCALLREYDLLELKTTEVAARFKVKAGEDYTRAGLRGLEQDAKRVLAVVVMEVVVEGAVVRENVGRHSRELCRLEKGMMVEVEEITKAGRARLTNPAGWVSIQSQAGMEVLRRLDAKEEEIEEEGGGEVGEESEVASVISAMTPSRGNVSVSMSPSAPTSLASSASNLLEDFCEIVLHKTPEQKLGICFAPGSRLVLSGCVEGSSSHENGLEKMLGHRLIKINNTAVKDKASIAPFAKEELLHLVFAKHPDRGWNAQTQVWTPPLLSTEMVGGVATAAFSGAMSGLKGLRKAQGKLRESSLNSLAAKKAD